MTTLSIDTETYSPVNLNQAGVHVYAAHPDFKILLFAYSIDGSPVTVIDLDNGDQIPAEIRDALTDPGVTKTAWNAAFERTCLAAHLGEPLPAAQWRCTMVWAAELGHPMRLDHAGKALGVTHQKLSSAGKRLINLFCAPTGSGSDLLGDGRNTKTTHPDQWRDFIEYNRRDVEVELQILDQLKAHPLPDSEWAAYAIDQEINDRGIRVDTALARYAVTADTETRERALARARDITGLANPNSPIQLTQWLQGQGLPVENLRKQDVTDLLATATGDAREVLELRQLTSKTSVKKYEAMLHSAGADGRARGLIQFYGAGRTGRYAGRRIQVQNLPRNSMTDLDAARSLLATGDTAAFETIYDPVPDTLSQLVRTALIPADGHVFVVSDFSAIEARVLAWLAGETGILDAFRDGKDIYCDTAERMFGVPVAKHGPNAGLRQKGKIATLACGYGGSVGALETMGALRMGLDEHELKPIVDAWRAANPRIVNYWADVEQAAASTVRTGRPAQTTGPGPRIRFRLDDDYLTARLPSGRSLYYPRPRLGTGRYGQTCVTYQEWVGAKPGRRDTYGGRLVENITQAVARDLLNHAIESVEAVGHQVVMHVHDEIVTETPVETTETAAVEIARLMSTPPEWAAGLPVDAGTYTCTYYKKD